MRSRGISNERPFYRGIAFAALVAAGAVFASQALAVGTFPLVPGSFPNTTHAHVVRIQMGGGGTGTVAIAVFDVALVGGPACAASNPTMVAFDIATDKGKAALQMFNSVILSGRSVTVLGSGTCTLTSAVENVNQMAIFSN